MKKDRDIHQLDHFGDKRMSQSSLRSRMVALGVLFMGSMGLSASPLDDQIAAFKNATTQTEGAVSQILQSGIKEHRSARAFAAAKSWLAAHPSSSQQLLFHAGQSAERAGDWSSAVSFYRKLLKNPQVDGRLAGEAAPAVYRLLINHLGDTEAAYLFMKEDGDRLRGFGRTKQFDAWFLDQAKDRNDLAAIANRLAAIYNSNDSLESFADTRAMLIRELETFRHGGEALFESLDRLSAAKRTTSQDRARINWVKEIVPLAAIMAEKVGAKEKIADELMDPALRAADSLVRALPYEGSIAVAKGWMFFRAGDSGVFATFVNPRREEKAAPVLRALAGLSAAKTRDVLGQQFPDSKNRKLAEYLLSEAELRALVIKIPAAFNDLSAPDVPLFDKTLTPEVAKAMAPHLARNPHAEAAMVRAWAKAEHKYSAVTDDMMKSEMWRFTEIKALTHGLWHSGMFERDVEHDVPIKKYEKLDAQFQKLKKQTSKEASSKDRLAAFKVLQGDLLGASPRIVGSLPLWSELFTNAPDPDKVTMLKSMTSNLQGGREFLLRRILPNCRFGKSGSIFWQAEVYDNHFRYHQKDTRENGAELLTHLTRTVESQAKAGTLSETVFGMWLHGIDVRDEKMQEVMKAIAKSPAYAKLDPAYHRAAADQHHFGEIALTPTLAAADPRYLSRELLALPKEAAPAQVEAALKAVVERSSKAPSTTAVVGLSQVAALPEWSAATRSLVLSLFKENAPIGDYPDRQGYEPLVIRIAKDTTESKKWNALEPYAAGLWQAAASPDHPRSQGASVLSSLAELMLKEDSPSLASTFCRVALRGPVGRVLFKKQDSEIPKIAARVNGVSGPAALAIGAVEIPVDETDPAYPIYKSNAEFVQGNLDSAWDLYLKNVDQLQPILRELSVDYGFWLLSRNTRMNRTEEGEALVKELTIWSRQAEGTFSLEQEAELKIAYADLAFLKGALPTSRAYYRRVADAKEYQGSEMGLRAALGSVKVDRASKNFGAAMTELDKLLRVKNVSFRNKVRYARAEVFMDQENYKEGLDEIEAVLLREPKHPDALILRGKIHNEMRKLVEASEIELGPSQENTVIVPGEAVKINLRDPTLRVSGVGADIEVEIWAKSGDRERVMLYQLGDNKEKFRAEVPTSLGPPVPGDKTLQILGEDEIRFGYSKRFRAKMDDLPDDPTVVISVASDARLDLTAGAFPPREGERRLAIEELGLSTAQVALGTRSVRPGNPVYLRLTDSDQSKTPGVDEVFVTLVTSSGDEIRRLALAETGPFTGEFQAIVPTSGAQALAFASESAPGRDPNMAISAEDYPGWMGKVGDKDEVRIFGVDLNDNVSVDKMSVTTGGVGESLTHFVLQTSMNGKDWTTRSRFPEAKNPAPWDGHPRISYSLRTNPARNSIYPLPKDRQLPDDWKQAMEVSSLRPKTSYDAEIVPNLTLGKLSQIGGFHPNEKVLFKFRALFYQPASAVRRFRLEGFPVAAEDNETGMVFFIDGLPAVGESEDPLAIERELGPGLHEIEIWSTESLGGIKERKPVLFCDEFGKDDLVPCPDAMFDPNNFPEGVHQKIDQQATISKTEKGFDFSFGDQTQARLVRLVIAGFEGVAPVIGKLTLSDRDRTTLLPVRQDFRSLRENTELEVLPGDQITARYEDPVTATPRRTRHEKRLTVAYNNAEITASFLNYETTEEGRVLILEPIRRFRFDDAVAIVIDDPDMDGSPEKDVIELLVTTASGGKATIKALETEEHSGRFLGRVFPVEGEPGRASEIQMSKGGSLTATYRDEENLDPGIPTDRSVTISHAVYQDPSISAYTIASKPLEVPVAEETDAVNTPGKRLAPEIVMPRRRLDYSHVESADSAKEPLQGVVGASLRFDVVVPHLALAGSSEIRAYVQTEAGRKSAEGTLKSPFDVGVPGTMKLTGVLEGVELAEPSGYEVGESPRPPSNEPPLEEGRFSFSVPLVLGDQPTRSFANKAAESLPRTSIPEGLIVKSGDIVHLGYPYKDVDDSVKWKTTSFRVGSHGFLDVMDGNYNSALTSSFVGEKIYVRVLDRGLDTGPARDTTTVTLTSSSGAETAYELNETEPHSGLFKGVFALSYADKKLPSKLPPVALNGFPVRYGDDVTISYRTDDGEQSYKVNVNKGADGLVEPFSKRFTGDSMAVQTSFTLAECFFELAKKHREMEQESLARREMSQAQKLLAEAVATHRDDELRAHAEYLLGNLAQEYADLSKNDEAKLPMYQDALSRFSKIPADYPDTEFASKAQFKTALVYEKMGEIDNAVEEYVKLAYKYPDDELIPEVMSRLGGYFQKKGIALKKQGDPLREKEDAESKAEVLRLDDLSYPEFLNAAMVFGKLEERFPDDKLAGLAGLRAAQNYMRALQYEKAIAGFEKVYGNEKYDDRDVRSQAMYWCGLSFERSAEPEMMEAYQLYRRITFDFPDSKWAKYARGRLADPAFARIIEIEKQERERLIEALKESRK